MKSCRLKNIVLLGVLSISLSMCSSGYQESDFVKQVIKEFTVADSLLDGNNEELDVIVFSGQSNATGIGRMNYLEKKISDEEYQVYENGFSHVLTNFYVDNGRNKSDEFTTVKLGQGIKQYYFGPELELAKQLNDDSSRRHVIVKYSYSGTYLYGQWYDRDQNHVGPLYTALINFTKTSLDYLIKKNYKPNLKALCWMQGEYDGLDSNYADKYDENLTEFVSNFRNDLKGYAQQAIHFIDGAILNDPSQWPYYKEVNDNKIKYSNTSDLNHYIDTNAYGLHTNEEPSDKPDLAHYDCLSYLKLGELFADEVKKIH